MPDEETELANFDDAILEHKLAMALFEENLEAAIKAAKEKDKEMSDHYANQYATKLGASASEASSQLGELDNLLFRADDIIDKAEAAINRLKAVADNILGEQPQNATGAGNVSPMKEGKIPKITNLGNKLSKLDNTMARLHSEINRFEKL